MSASFIQEIHGLRRRSVLLVVLILAGSSAAAGVLAGPAGAATLPDHRVYELVTRFEKEGHEADLNGVQAGYGYTSRDGNSLEWRAVGGCCGATSAAQETYRSYRTADGWQTESLMPAPNGGEEGGLASLFGGGGAPEPEFWTPDMQRVIFAVPKTYAGGVVHPNDQDDLYLREPDEEFTLVSKGPLSTGEELRGSIFDGATPDGNYVVFSSSEPLTSDATGLRSGDTEWQYLYVRDLLTGTTTLVDVDDTGALLGVEGASLGNAGYLNGGLLPADNYGTSTNAISADGSKVFFQTPLTSAPPVRLDAGESHLYIRDLADSTTTALDEPSSSGWARYEGASEDGSLVFFTSNEGLDGAPAIPELYVFNTTGASIGRVPSMSSVPISLGEEGVAPATAGAVEGITAIADDGSRVYFVAGDILAANRNPAGAEAVEGKPNLYLYEEASGATTYVATLGAQDVSTCEPDCAGGRATQLIGEPDISRRAFPTPDGSTLVFESTADLTGENDALQTRLTAPVSAGEHTIHVESTEGLEPSQWILIGSGGEAEREKIKSIDGPTELTVAEFDEEFAYGIVGEFAVGVPVSRPEPQAYRFGADGSLICLSCAGGGEPAAGYGTLGITSGGTYAPAGQNVPMNEDATQIFFESSVPLVPEAQPARAGHEAESSNVYEWEDGQVHLISDGTTAGSILDGTTPSGENVFFSTRSQLTSGSNGDWINVYDARVGGGFPESGTETAPCSGQACRGATAGTRLSEVPASSLGATEEVAGNGRGSFKVQRLTATQRRRLARTGRLSLGVTATSRGTLTAKLWSTIDGKDTAVARASARLAKAGKAELRLLLDRPARKELVARGSLALRLDVTFSAGDKRVSTRLTLRAPGAGRKARHG